MEELKPLNVSTLKPVQKELFICDTCKGTGKDMQGYQCHVCGGLGYIRKTPQK